MTYTRKDLESMDFDELKKLRDSVYDRYFYKDGPKDWRGVGRRVMDPDRYHDKTIKAAYEKERKLLEKVYQERRVVTPLEKEWRETFDDARKRMDKELSDAHDAISRAVAISEETGIPMDTYVSPLSNKYTPDNDKFAKLDPEVLEEFEIYPDEYGWYGGWEHSAVC